MSFFWHTLLLKRIELELHQTYCRWRLPDKLH